MTTKEKCHLRLFVAGNGSDTTEAINNLERINAENLSNSARIEIIDIKKEPDLALENMVIATPMLIMEAPEPKVTIIGNLSDTKKVLLALQISDH